MTLPQDQADAITVAISPARMGTYLNATGFGTRATALDIYVWNALVSSAFFSTLHIAEVVVRNAIAQALELKYGGNWPWNAGFERSLPKWSKVELQSAKRGVPFGSTGKVIAELKFAFWCGLFTKAQDQHIWNAHLHTVFPFLPFPLTVAAGRKMLYDDMEALRGFRNRIAHHEPIIAYPLAWFQNRIHRLVAVRCEKTAAWLSQWEVVSVALAARP
ncbi:hypothetical protein JOD97_002280 [Duganella sp. 1411]|uniref:hypothetical protein n=1 Tax=Duganella sp. 1411 TaxID=2806572 RepID=UPI001AE6A64C|nr:hypothetical protein [Duganella sp. 1411]MBP1204266.1 hypothetical protein [Duganella sp. 1411]